MDVIEVETAAGLPPMLPRVVAVVRPTLVGAIVELFTYAMEGRKVHIHTLNNGEEKSYRWQMIWL